MLSEFGDSLSTLMNRELGWDDFQHQFNDNDGNIITDKDDMDMSDMPQQIVDVLFDRMTQRLRSLHKIKHAILSMAKANSTKTVTPKTCYDDTRRQTTGRMLGYDPIFKTQVDINNMCVYPTDKHLSPAVNISNDLLAAFRLNKKAYERVGWQHLHVIGGEHWLYPSVHVDPDAMRAVRTKAWYVNLTMPKTEMVVVIDTSLAMFTGHIKNKTLLDVAKDITTQIISRQSIHCKLAVVAFASRATCAGEHDSCYWSMAVSATQSNKAVLLDFVANLSHDHSSVSSYIVGLRKALLILRGNTVSIPVVIFLTGAAPTEAGGEVLNFVSNMTSEFTEIHIITFGIGLEGNSEKDLLRNMSKTPASLAMQPLFIEIQVFADEGDAMHLFYNYFLPIVPKQYAIVSTPHLCLVSKETAWTVAMPIRHQGRLIAIAGIDVMLTEVLLALRFLKQTGDQYFFVINNDRNTMYHPNFPYAEEEGETNIVDIKHLEKEAYREGIIDSMLQHTEGNKTIKVIRNIPRGDTYREAYREVTSYATYYWKPFSQFPFIVAVVKHKRRYYKFRTIYKQKVQFGNVEYSKKNNLCNHFGKVSTVKTSTLQWSPYAFSDPIQGMSTNETTDQLQTYGRMLSGEVENTVFANGVMDQVQLTVSAHSYWLRSQAKNAVRRYVVLSKGIMRIFPGEWQDRSYDPQQKSWYKNAALFPSRVAVSMPYLDSRGAGDIISLSKAISLSDGTKVGEKFVIGVMGIDVTIGCMRARLYERFPMCKSDEVSCFMMDTSGHVIVHDAMLEPPKDDVPPRTSNVHITTLEPAIASDLIIRNVMKRVSCNDLLSMHRHFMYDVKITPVDSFDIEPYYSMGHVPSSNIFIIAKKNIIVQDTDSLCVCDSENGSIPACRGDAYCQCPCSKVDGGFDYCENNFVDNWTLCEHGYGYVPRFPPQFQYDTMDDERAVLSTLQSCYSYKCHRHQQREFCDLVSGCKWCVADKLGKKLSKPYCEEYFACYYGQMGYPSPYGFDVPREKVDACGALCIIFGGSAVVLCLAVSLGVALVIWIYRRKIRALYVGTPLDNHSRHVTLSNRAAIGRPRRRRSKERSTKKEWPTSRTVLDATEQARIISLPGIRNSANNIELTDEISTTGRVSPGYPQSLREGESNRREHRRSNTDQSSSPAEESLKQQEPTLNKSSVSVLLQSLLEKTLSASMSDKSSPRMDMRP